MTNRGLFVAGTGTGVGKTHVASMIARSLVDVGRRVGVYKPVASGCQRSGDRIVADDARQLWDAARRPGEFERVCPQCFVAPLAPPRAAREEGRSVDSLTLRSGIDYWSAISEIVLVEGAGGLMSPLSDADYNVDLASDFGFPLVIVADNQLGVINAVMQTVIVAQFRAPDLPIAGIVLNHPFSRDGDASLASNAEEIAQRCPAPVLATIRFAQETFDNEVDWYALAAASA